MLQVAVGISLTITTFGQYEVYTPEHQFLNVLDFYLWAQAVYKRLSSNLCLTTKTSSRSLNLFPCYFYLELPYFEKCYACLNIDSSSYQSNDLRCK